jgi:chromosome segregation ATPase
VPTELVTKILAYYNTNQDEYIKYLADQHLKRQGLNDTIRVQEQQIASIKEELTETAAVKKYSAERGEKIKELSQNLKDKDETINNLTFKIHKLEEGNFAIQDNENEELIKALMLKINELEEANRNRKEEDSKTSQDLDSAEQGQRVKELEQDVRDKEDIINDLFVKIHKLEEALVETARKQKGESSKPYKAAREKKMQELDRNVKDRDNTISALSLRIQELEEAGRARKEARSKVSQGPAPSARKMIDSAKAIKASLLESKVRCLLLQAKNYIDNKEYPAAAGVMDQAEVIMCQELPHLEVLRGKVLYRHGRAMYEMGFLPEAIQGFKSALKMGFDANCNEVDGDCVQPWLVKARAAQGKAVRLGYPA